MKPINQYRKTEQFCINGTIVRIMSELHKSIESEGKGTYVIAMASHPGDIHRYTVRVQTPATLEDRVMEVSGTRIETIERKVITER